MEYKITINLKALDILEVNQIISHIEEILNEEFSIFEYNIEKEASSDG